MKRYLIAALLVTPIAFHSTFAATVQQNKMATCNKDASDKKGDERKVFMKECLSNKPKVSEAQESQQDKMKTCNADAKDKKGGDRKQFMRACLKKS